MGYYELSWAKKLGQKGLKAAHILTQFACKDSWEKKGTVRMLNAETIKLLRERV